MARCAYHSKGDSKGRPVKSSQCKRKATHLMTEGKKSHLCTQHKNKMSKFRLKMKKI